MILLAALETLLNALGPLLGFSWLLVASFGRSHMLFVIFKRLLCIFLNFICWKTTLHENCLNLMKNQ